MGDAIAAAREVAAPALARHRAHADATELVGVIALEVVEERQPVAAAGPGGPHQLPDALAAAQQNAGAGERMGAARGRIPGEMDVDLAGSDLAHQLGDAV